MLWIAYEYSGDPVFKNQAKQNTISFINRIDDRFVVDHHDIGFLYIPSLVANYKITGDEIAREYALKAADILVERFMPMGEFIQAWGDKKDPKEYRFIVDSLINIPLLYWAYEETKDARYIDIANAHFETVIKYGVRSDCSSHHTFYFDPETGKPIGGQTAQGFSDDSCWARGQAWVVLGSILNFKYDPKDNKIEVFDKCYDYYKRHLPEDLVPYWDLVFDYNSNQYHDSSTTAIILNALIEYEVQMDDDKHHQDVVDMVDSLISDYSITNQDNYDGLLDHGVYAYANHKGIDEANLWGDYFYMEALYRLYTKNEWRGYW